ncbi:GntR family transcriptional regulator [Botrimarina sp.]|uniref:GntR family transcriptional regulator n=1 Tax=Botrimarina sp. TaxID=2795802 RepID=UPI0032EE13DD
MPSSTTHNGRAGAPRRLLRSEAYEKIKDMIISGDYEPGVFLSERQLTARLKMSKTPIRTALERLDSEGFVVISPQQGVLVKELSFHEIADLFETRIVLETYTVQSLSEGLTATQRDSIDRLLESQQDLLVEQSIEGTAEVDLHFHLTLTNCLGNQEILRVMNQLRDKLLLIFTRHLRRNPHRLLSNYDEHRAIADAIFSGDGAAAAELMRTHLLYGRDYMLSNGRGGDASQASRPTAAVSVAGPSGSDGKP